MAGIRDWDGEDFDWYSFVWKPGMSYAEMLRILDAEVAGRGLPEGRVPATMLYAFVNGEIVGRVSVRHLLNDKLRQRGGHIGYAVSPRHRRRGFATQMLTKALVFSRGLSLKSVMITCADTNVPSIRLIESQGGVLKDKVWDGEEDELLRRYWIDLA